MAKLNVITNQTDSNTTYAISNYSYDKALILSYKDLVTLCDLLIENNENFKEKLDIEIKTKRGTYKRKSLDKQVVA